MCDKSREKASFQSQFLFSDGQVMATMWKSQNEGYLYA